jgi:hypothetical protein
VPRVDGCTARGISEVGTGAVATEEMVQLLQTAGAHSQLLRPLPSRPQPYSSGATSPVCAAIVSVHGGDGCDGGGDAGCAGCGGLGAGVLSPPATLTRTCTGSSAFSSCTGSSAFSSYAGEFVRSGDPGPSPACSLYGGDEVGAAGGKSPTARRRRSGEMPLMVRPPRLDTVHTHSTAFSARTPTARSVHALLQRGQGCPLLMIGVAMCVCGLP